MGAPAPACARCRRVLPYPQPWCPNLLWHAVALSRAPLDGRRRRCAGGARGGDDDSGAGSWGVRMPSARGCLLRADAYGGTANAAADATAVRRSGDRRRSCGAVVGACTVLTIAGETQPQPAAVASGGGGASGWSWPMLAAALVDGGGQSWRQGRLPVLASAGACAGGMCGVRVPGARRCIRRAVDRGVTPAATAATTTAV